MVLALPKASMMGELSSSSCEGEAVPDACSHDTWHGTTATRGTAFLARKSACTLTQPRHVVEEERDSLVPGVEVRGIAHAERGLRESFSGRFQAPFPPAVTHSLLLIALATAIE